jgi:uncharacterized protein YukE
MNSCKNNKESDVLRIRQEYLNSLDVEVQINKIVEQAVINQKKTGLPPPITQMRDTRTPSEILMDFQKIKIQLIKDLSTVSDPLFAETIVSKILQSPLNNENKLFIFLANRSDELIKSLKKIYKYGIVGDVTDAENFVNYIHKYYTDKNVVTSNIKAVMSSFGASNNLSFQSKAQQLHNTMNRIYSILSSNMNIFNRIINASKDPSRATLAKTANDMYKNIKEYMERYMHILPRDDMVLKRIQEISTMDLLDFSDINDYLRYVNNNIPSFEWLLPLISQMNYKLEVIDNLSKQGSTNLSPSVTSYTNILQHIEDQINQGEKIQELNNIVATYDAIIEYFLSNPLPAVSGSQQVPIDISFIDEKWKPFDFDPNKRKVPKVDYGKSSPKDPFDEHKGASIDDDADDDDGDLSALIGTEEKKEGEITEEDKAEASRGKGLTNKPTTKIGDAFKTGFSNFGSSDKRVKKLGRMFKSGNTKISDIPMPIGHVLKPIAGDAFDAPAPTVKTISGSGLTAKQKFAIDRDPEQGIQPSIKYVRFGKYYVNKHLLDNDRLSFRSATGNGVPALPSYRMSKGFGMIIRRLIGGSNPSHEEINALTPEEKAYLAKVSRMSKITDKIALDTPSKDSEEKDIHRFNVLKGEIMAGNDGKVVIKEFKILALKLANNNILPKKQINEILQDLLAMGY